VAENHNYQKQQSYPYIYDIESGNSLQNICPAVIYRFDSFHLFPRKFNCKFSFLPEARRFLGAAPFCCGAKLALTIRAKLS